MKRVLSLVLWVAAALTLLPARSALAAVRPNPLFSDGMVLQREMPVPVWGTASDGEKVSVRFQGQSVSTTAKDGKWMVRLRPLRAGGPAEMTIAGENSVPIRNVLVGEVWICSGQSNMQWSVRQSADPEATIAASSHPQLRLFTVPRQATDEPLAEVKGEWKECGPATVPDFSAVAYHFGVDLQKALGVPVGLINTSYGGTPAEAWTSRGMLEGDRGLREILAAQASAVQSFPQAQARHQQALTDHGAAAEKARTEGRQPPAAPRAPVDPSKSAQRPVGLYNAMIAPLVPYAIRGAIWYQGESNAGRAYQYQTLFPAMIRDWRRAWGEGDFPFLFVQLAPFMPITNEPGDSAWAELREAQRLTTRRLANTAMAVITDVGEEGDIHPKQKAPVGQRLAQSALALFHGRPLIHSGPEYLGMRVEGDRAIVSFTNLGRGLVAKGSSLQGFTIAGPDRKFVNAQAELRGSQVIVSSPQVPNPVAVRYGWANFPVVNLWNQDGLPASPFRTDDFPLTTMPKP